MDSPHNVSVWDTLPSYLYLAQVNAGISILYCRSKIKESLSDF